MGKCAFVKYPNIFCQWLVKMNVDTLTFHVHFACNVAQLMEPISFDTSRCACLGCVFNSKKLKAKELLCKDNGPLPIFHRRSPAGTDAVS